MITTKLGTLMPQALPSAPEAALRIVRACGDPKVTDNDLQQIFSTDSAVSAELLRIVNSPLFGLRRPVTEIEQAVLVWGRRLLRNGALVFIARETLRTQSIVQFDARRYLEDTLRRAVAARLLAVAVGMDVDDAFTLGMLQDLGMLTLLTAYPEMAPAWSGLRRANPDQRRRREMELFGVTHRQVGKMLAERWQLPDELLLPLAHHHDQLLDDFPAYINQLCQLTTCADWVAAVYTATDKRLALARCQHLLAACFNLDQHASSALLAQVPAAMSEAAAALDSRISQQASFEELMVDANRWMIEEHHRGEDGAQNLEMALQERERFAEELQTAFERLAQLAYYDPLTSLVNRRRFDELFLTEIVRHSRSGHPMSVLMVDLDGFKQVNDTYGHCLGDEVLRRVARTVKHALRVCDVAARIGGDELCVLLPDTGIEGGKAAAARLCKAVADLRFVGGLAGARVSVSIGGGSWSGRYSREIDLEAIHDSLIDNIDKALYISKNNGRNQVKWLQLE